MKRTRRLVTIIIYIMTPILAISLMLLFYVNGKENPNEKLMSDMRFDCYQWMGRVREAFNEYYQENNEFPESLDDFFYQKSQSPVAPIEPAEPAFQLSYFKPDEDSPPNYVIASCRYDLRKEIITFNLYRDGRIEEVSATGILK